MGVFFSTTHWIRAMNFPSISACGEESMEAAVTLLSAQLREHDLETSIEALRGVTRAVISDPRHGFILLAAAEGEFIGIAYAAAHLSAEHGGIIGWLEELYVLPEWRSHGVGSLLLGEVITRARDLGWRGLELEVVAGHERAVSLYRRHGFHPLSRARFSQIFGR